jgi:outer membrane lipoprotein-sorting protein
MAAFRRTFMRSSYLSSILSSLHLKRGRKLAVAILVVSALTCGCAGQLAVPQQAQRDQQALSILSQTLQAAGGVAALSAVQDFTGTGRITYYWDDEVSGTVTVRGRGLSQFRIDATLPEGVRTVIASKDASFVAQPDGTVQPIPRDSAKVLRSMTLPYPVLIAAIQDSWASVEFLGLVDHGGKQVYDIRIERVLPKRNDIDGLLRKQSVRDVFIDPTSFLVTSTLTVLDPTADGPGGVPHEILFSNYQAVNGLAIPFSITETVRGGQQLLTMQLSQVSINTGLTDADFSQ